MATVFLECRAPYAADRSRGEAGRSLPPGPGRNAGPTPAYWAQRRPRIPSSAPITPVAKHRGCDAQLPCDLRQRPTAARQQGNRLPLELIRKLTTALGPLDTFPLPLELSKGVHQFGGGSVWSRHPTSRLQERSRLGCVCRGLAPPAYEEEEAGRPQATLTTRAVENIWPRSGRIVFSLGTGLASGATPGPQAGALPWISSKRSSVLRPTAETAALNSGSSRYRSLASPILRCVGSGHVGATGS